MSYSHHLPYPEEEHVARLACGDPKAEAFTWIERYAENLSDDADDDDDAYYGSQTVTADELISTGMHNVESSDGWGDYIVKGPLLEGVSVDPTFWEKLAILKDIQIPEEKRNNFFSCSC